MDKQLRETLFFGDSDCLRYLTDDEYAQLIALHDKITEGRLADNKMAVFGVFVPEGHQEFQNISALFNQASGGDKPVVLLPSAPWYGEVQALVGPHMAGQPLMTAHGFPQTSIATLGALRQRVSPMIKELARVVRKETVNVSTQLAVESSQLQEHCATLPIESQQYLDAVGEWERHDEGFDLTMSALQCTMERLHEAGFHLSRVTNTNAVLSAGRKTR